MLRLAWSPILSDPDVRTSLGKRSCVSDRVAVLSRNAR